MKKIINGKRYDTDTATLLHAWESGYDSGDFHYYEEGLYRTPKGNLFIAGGGGAMSPYSESLGGGSYGGGSGIRPVDRYEALAWLEGHEGTRAIEEHFADEIEDA